MKTSDLEKVSKIAAELQVVRQMQKALGTGFTFTPPSFDIRCIPGERGGPTLLLDLDKDTVEDLLANRATDLVGKLSSYGVEE